MSPTLFNVYTADFDREMEKRGIGGVSLGKDRIWVLAYADDLILLAKNRTALTDMLSTLGRFLQNGGLKLNVNKTKIMIFNKSGKEKKEKWNWKKEQIEEVLM